MRNQHGPPLDTLLTPENGFLFRITHRLNVPWLLRNGLPCVNSSLVDPDFVQIGSSNLISERPSRRVRIAPGGTLADYVPFYFTPKSIMLKNIVSGHRKDVTQRPNRDIAIFLSSCGRMASAGVTMLYTDRHAFMLPARWTSDVDALPRMINWDILQRHDFARSDDFPEKMDRYQAEALAHRHVPTSALLGIACVSEAASHDLEAAVAQAGLNLRVVVRPHWYFH